MNDTFQKPLQCLLSILFQFLVLLNQFEKTNNLSLDCLCPAGPTPCSSLKHFNTRLGIILCSRPRLSLPCTDVGGEGVSWNYWALIRFEILAFYHQNLCIFWGVWFFQIFFGQKVTLPWSNHIF